MPRVCVECGVTLDSLYVEFSEGNIRLTRCEKCGSVADKYIEYELVLVLIDIVLHRQPAYRHLLHNRHILENNNSIVFRWALLIVVVNWLLMAVVQHEFTLAAPGLVFTRCLFLLLVSAAEHLAFVAVMAMFLYFSPVSRYLFAHQSKLKRKLYMALAFPELFKTLVVLLQVFDSEPSLLLLFGALVISMQHASLQSITNIKSIQLSLFLCLAVLARILIRSIFFGVSEGDRPLLFFRIMAL